MKRNVLDYLEESAHSFPDKTAVADEYQKYSYTELLTISRRIGSALADMTGLRKPVAVLTEKSADTLCVFMGIVQAGCFYSLLNPELPLNRLEQMVSVLDDCVLITDRENIEAAEKLVPQDRIVIIDRCLHSEENAALLKSIREKIIDTDPLYANFTSGSTGIPKCVIVNHRSVIDFIDIFVPMFSISESDIIGNQAPFDFDVSVKDIYSALKASATLEIIPRALFSRPAALIDHVCSRSITTMIWAVSALCLISTCHGLDYRVPQSVKRVLFSGEVMPAKHLAAWMEHLPDADFVNLYGPTEITCNCTYHRIERDRDYACGIPIGKPFPNRHVFLLDEHNSEITEPGVTGEICVRGTSLALGYYGDRTLTDASFPNNPLSPQYPERIYRSGDLGKYAADGNLMFCGRKDNQIKYMGHRIELEEIERAASKVPGVDRCCIVFSEKKKRIIGFYTGEADKKSLIAALRKSLPGYMIPGTLKQLDAIPLTKNGKADRKKMLGEQDNDR